MLDAEYPPIQSWRKNANIDPAREIILPATPLLQIVNASQFHVTDEVLRHHHHPSRSDSSNATNPEAKTAMMAGDPSKFDQSSSIDSSCFYVFVYFIMTQ